MTQLASDPPAPSEGRFMPSLSHDAPILDMPKALVVLTTLQNYRSS